MHGNSLLRSAVTVSLLVAGISDFKMVTAAPGVKVATPPASSELSSLDKLEIRVWTADDYELPSVERDVVRSIQLEPSSARAHYLLTHIMTRQFARDPGDLYLLKQAADLAQQAMDLDPMAPFGYVAMAGVMDLMGSPERGLALLTEAENFGLEPSWRFYFARARLVADDQQVGRVFGLFETALGFQDSMPQLIAPYVIAMLQSTSHGEELIEKLASWNQRFPSPLFELTMAIAYAELGHAKRAHELYSNIIKKHPDNKEAKVNDAILLYRDLEEPKKSVALLENVLQQHKAELTENVESMVLAHLAAAELRQKHYGKAEQRFVDSLKGNTNNLTIVDFITKSYRGAKAPTQLVRLIRRLNDALPGAGVLHALLGETLSEDLANHDAALRAFANAIILDPSRSDYYNGMGLTYYRKKSYPDALKLFVTATEVDPNDATARYNEACVLALMGQSDAALSSLSEALSLDPRLMLNARTDEDFTSIRSHIRFRDLVQLPSDGPFSRSESTSIGH